jgi:16S rRNA (guanine(1405)-N(7))-methyltransferase
LDLACGLNPLALPWIPLEQGASYYACDIYQNMVDFINLFFAHTGQPGKAENVNLQDKVPAQKVQLAFLLKTLPCLEQLDKHISRRLLDSINAEHMLITYPAQSLGGQSKGMPATYTAQFQQLAQDRDWQVESFQFPGEIAFLVHRTSL